MLRSKSEAEVTESYDIKVKEYINGRIELTIYDRKIKRIKSGYELSNIKNNDLENNINNKKRDNQELDNKELRQDNIYRSYKMMIDYALENSSSFNTFITLTFKENLIDITEANKLFNKWCLQIRRNFPEFIYLGSPEYQKRGAVHYHIMTNLSIDESNLITLQPTKNNMYDVKYWIYGYSSVFDLKLTDNKFSVAAYLSKYYFKDIDNRLFGRKKLLKSNNLKKPKEVIMNKNSIEYKNYFDYLSKTKELVNKKNILTANKYAPNLEILTYE